MIQNCRLKFSWKANVEVKGECTWLGIRFSCLERGGITCDKGQVFILKWYTLRAASSFSASEKASIPGKHLHGLKITRG